MNKKFMLGAAVVLAMTASADTHTVAAGTTENLSGLTETTRFVKDGAGTLVLGGVNSFKRATMAEGDLTISGGSTTISDAHDGNAKDSGNIFAMSGGNLTLTDGATLTMSTTDGKGYLIQHGGTFLVTNATLDATGVDQYLNGFTDNGTFSENRFVIATGGVVRAKVFRPSGARSDSLRELTSLDLNKGGELYLNYFFADSNDIRYGRINFNGGVVIPLIAGTNSSTRLFLQDETRKPWTDGGVVPTVREGGFYLRTTKNNQFYVKFESGAEHDGGAHFSGKGAIYWRTKNSTYNGGTWLESNEGAILALNSSAGDSALGALPTEPTTNIWVTGSNHTLFSESGTTEIEGNRTIFVKDGRRLYTGSQGRLVIKGEIRGEVVAGKDGPMGTALHARNSWNGTTVLHTGEGRTNDIGRLVDFARLEITSGVTRVVSELESKTDENTALVYVEGNHSAYDNYKGHLLVNGGTLLNTQSGVRYVIARQYAQVEVTNGGMIDMRGVTYVNGLTSPATLTIADGGCVCVTNFQIANSTTAVLNLKKGGVLDTLDFWSSAASTGIINFDGGSIRVTRSTDPNGIALGKNGGADRWVNAQIYVKEGGAVFDTANRHLWLRHPLQSGAEHDGGVRKTGSQVLVIQSVNTYNGPTRIEQGSMQVRTPVNGLPVGTTIVLTNGTTVAFSNYDSQHSHTTQTVARVEGHGLIRYNSMLTVTDGVAPSVGGLTFDYACSLGGDFEIRGNAEACGYLKVAGGQDISNLTLKMVDADALDPHARANLYKILDAPDGFTGTFRKSADWPLAWDVKYAADGKSAYVYHVNGTQIIVR